MQKSRLNIYSALVTNIFIAVTKFIAGSISNSLVMISEGIHSIVHTVNELLLLWGHPPKQQTTGFAESIWLWKGTTLLSKVFGHPARYKPG